MGTRARQLSITVATLWLGLGSVTPTWSDPAFNISILVQDHAQVPRATFTKAEQVVAGVYRKIGVDVVWYHSGAEYDRLGLGDPATRDASLRSILILSIVPPSAEARLGPQPDVMGQAFRDSRYAMVFYGRVAGLAERGGRDVDLVLGYVIAHEIGHLLLPTSGHTIGGLMSARLDPQLMSQGVLEFDRTQATSIRACLASRR